MPRTPRWRQSWLLFSALHTILPCRYTTFSLLAGIDPTDKWTDPDTKFVHDVDGINQWPSIISGKASPRTLPTTHKSLLVDDGKGHMYKLINGNVRLLLLLLLLLLLVLVLALVLALVVVLVLVVLVLVLAVLVLVFSSRIRAERGCRMQETRADRFHANGSVYEDPFHPCLPGSRRRDCHSAAPPSTFSRCFNRDVDRASAK